MEKPHRKLDAWKAAMKVATLVYRATETFPDDERFGMVSQLRRAAVSIPSNIAEGAARGSDPDYVRFLNMARGSISEVDTQLELSNRLGYLDDKQTATLDRTLTKCDRLLAGLISAISN